MYFWNILLFIQAEMASFVDSLHQSGRHFVPIIDPGIMAQSGLKKISQIHS